MVEREEPGTTPSLPDLSRVKRFGVFGGTFDPIHDGHLLLAERAREELKLDAVLFMPAYIPPHKSNGKRITPPRARLEMIRRAIEPNAAFHVTTLELDREGISYTVDSLETLHTHFPNARIVLLMGSDNARDFSSWKNPKRILELSDIAVWERPGSYYWPEIFPDYIADRIRAPLVEISSTDIRNRVSNGATIRYMTSDPVVEYISEHGLYR